MKFGLWDAFWAGWCACALVLALLFAFGGAK